MEGFVEDFMEDCNFGKVMNLLKHITKQDKAANVSLNLDLTFVTHDFF